MCWGVKKATLLSIRVFIGIWVTYDCVLAKVRFPLPKRSLTKKVNQLPIGVAVLPATHAKVLIATQVYAHFKIHLSIRRDNIIAFALYSAEFCNTIRSKADIAPWVLARSIGRDARIYLGKSSVKPNRTPKPSGPSVELSAQ